MLAELINTVSLNFPTKHQDSLWNGMLWSPRNWSRQLWTCLGWSQPFTRVSWWLSGQESTCNAGDEGDMGLIPGLGKSLGRGHGYPLQYSCLENPMSHREAWQTTVHRVTKSQTQLKWFITHTHSTLPRACHFPTPTPTPVVRHNPRDKFHRNTLWSRLCTSLASAVH